MEYASQLYHFDTNALRILSLNLATSGALGSALTNSAKSLETARDVSNILQAVYYSNR